MIGKYSSQKDQDREQGKNEKLSQIERDKEDMTNKCNLFSWIRFSNRKRKLRRNW